MINPLFVTLDTDFRRVKGRMTPKLFFFFTATFIGATESVEVKMTWKSSQDVDEIEEYYVLYKPVKEKEIWRFQKTVTPSATLLLLQPSTDYEVRVVGYTDRGEVYASRVTHFTTKGKPIVYDVKCYFI